MTAVPATTTRQHWWSSPSARRELRWALFFISPWIIGFLVFTAGPMLWSLFISFTSYDPLRGTAPWVGTDNYERMLSDPNARLALEHTLFYAMLHVPGQVIIGLALALLLDRVGRGASAFRTIFYLPNVTPAVAIGALFLLILNANGVLNQALR